MSLDDNTQMVDAADVKAYVGFLMMDYNGCFDSQKYILSKFQKAYFFLKLYKKSCLNVFYEKLEKQEIGYRLTIKKRRPYIYHPRSIYPEFRFTKEELDIQLDERLELINFKDYSEINVDIINKFASLLGERSIKTYLRYGGGKVLGGRGILAIYSIGDHKINKILDSLEDTISTTIKMLPER